jgi:rare lipoprotein A
MQPAQAQPAKVQLVQQARAEQPKQRIQPAQMQPAPVQVAQRVQPQVRERVQTTQTAYAAEPQAPRVMFGNMLLEPPKPGQRY